MVQPDEREMWSWAAGFFDAEGSLSRHPTFGLNVWQADPEPLHRFRQAVGAGRVTGPYRKRSGSNKVPAWSFQIYATPACEQIIDRLWPYLGWAKRMQILAALGPRRHPTAELGTGPLLDPEDRLSLAWCAGFLEGDGSFSFPARSMPVVSITQVDRRSLERFALIMRLGKVYGPYDPHPSSVGVSPVHNYRAHGLQNMQAIAAMLWGWLGPKKRRQATITLRRAAVKSTRLRCTRGHPKEPDAKGCAACHRDYWHRYRRGIGPQGQLFEPRTRYVLGA